MKSITLQTGELVVGQAGDIFSSGPLGSCIAVIIVAPEQGVGGMAHVMLPGRSRGQHNVEENKYAENAIDNLMNELARFGVDYKNCRAWLIGAGNVLKRPDDNICASNIFSVVNYLGGLGITILRSELGGEERRTATLDLAEKEIRYTVGNNKEIVFEKIQ